MLQLYVLGFSFLLITFSTTVDQKKISIKTWRVLSPKSAGGFFMEHVSKTPITAKHQESRRDQYDV